MCDSVFVLDKRFFSFVQAFLGYSRKPVLLFSRGEGGCTKKMESAKTPITLIDIFKMLLGEYCHHCGRGGLEPDAASSIQAKWQPQRHTWKTPRSPRRPRSPRGHRSSPGKRQSPTKFGKKRYDKHRPPPVIAPRSPHRSPSPLRLPPAFLSSSSAKSAPTPSPAMEVRSSPTGDNSTGNSAQTASSSSAQAQTKMQTKNTASDVNANIEAFLNDSSKRERVEKKTADSLFPNSPKKQKTEDGSEPFRNVLLTKLAAAREAKKKNAPTTTPPLPVAPKTELDEQFEDAFLN